MTDSLPRAVLPGTDHYYRDRLSDFKERWPDAAPPSYYADYGDKCLHQFRRTEPDLTAQGQQWLQATLVTLQERMEDRRASDPAEFGRLERDSDAFEAMAFEMHSDAYLESGLTELPVSDLVKIIKTPDVADLLTPQGLKEIVEVVAGMKSDRHLSLPRRALRSLIDLVSGRRP